MVKWKNIWVNAPTRDCTICLRTGMNYEVFNFRILSTYPHVVWELYKFNVRISAERVSKDAAFIILEDVTY